MWLPFRWQSLFPQYGSLRCLLWFPGRPIWRSLKNKSIQPRHDCMSSPFVACFLCKYYWKKFISFKKNRDEKEQEYKFKFPRYWSGEQMKEVKYWLTITVIAYFPNYFHEETHIFPPPQIYRIWISFCDWGFHDLLALLQVGPVVKWGNVWCVFPCCLMYG